jgi:hypothetical protein
MGIKRNRKQLVAAAIALVGLVGGSVAAHASTFSASVGQLAAPASWPSITPTTCQSGTGTALDPCVIALNVGTGSVTVADVVNGLTNVPFLGFGVNGNPASLAGSPNSTIKVPVGTVLNITVSGGPIDLSFPSLPIADVVDNGAGSYTVTASKVGTSVFQPGGNAQAPKQIASGLVGVLIVTPAGCTGANLMCGYDATSYEDEALVAMTDLDLEYATDPSGFDMGYFGQSIDPDFSPRQVYHLINGKAFPDTDVIEARAGDDVLLRYVNAGVSDKTMGLLGLRQTLIARNASLYTDPQTFIAPLVGPGETADVTVAIPATATAGQFFSLMDQGQQLNNGTANGFGGALTFLNVRADNLPTVDGLAAVAGVSIPATVTVGNPLVDRAYATDYPTPIGTLSPVLVALTASPLSAGTLESFETWNQATAGGSPTPSAGGLLHTYVLRPTANPNEYDVIYDSGELTVPPLSGVISEAVSFPTVGVAVEAGDVIAYFGQGVPVDVGGGSDVLVYDPSTPVDPPADGDIITLGSGGYPIYSTDRTYSFAATVAPAPVYTGTTALTATGHSSGSSHNVTGYQTVVNSGATPAPGDWSATTPAGPSATVSITATVSAVPGQTVWIRVQQDASIWSNPASIVVPAP